MSHRKYILDEQGSDPTPREMQVLRLIAEGLQSKEIANRLGMSPKTIEFHKTRLYERLGVTGMVGAVRLAMRRGWLPPDVDVPLQEETGDENLLRHSALAT